MVSIRIARCDTDCHTVERGAGGGVAARCARAHRDGDARRTRTLAAQDAHNNNNNNNNNNNTGASVYALVRAS